jgi:acyl-CoA dehydrogenase
MGGEQRFNHGEPEVYYRDCRVPAENLLGKRGQGFAIAQMRLGPGRIHHCMRWLGQANRAYRMLLERAVQREVGGERLADKQTVQNWIADSRAEIEAARLMTLKAAWVMDTQGVKAARTDISMIKYFGAKVLHDVIDRSIQVHGGLGFTADMPLERMYRWARAARLVDGADEVHRASVARHVLKGIEAAPGIWPSEHVPTRQAAAREKFADYLTGATANL